MDKVKIAGVRRYLMAVYLLIITIMGVLFVPVKLVWGPDNEIFSMDNVPIWNMVRSIAVRLKRIISMLMHGKF